MHPQHTPAVAERGATGAFGGGEGGVAATPLPHAQNRGMSSDRGVATPWSATGRGCSVCATKSPTPARIAPTLKIEVLSQNPQIPGRTRIAQKNRLKIGSGHLR